MLLSTWSTYYICKSPEDAVKGIKEAGFDTMELSRDHVEMLNSRFNRSQTIKDFASFLIDNDCPITQAHLPMLDIQEDYTDAIIDTLKDRIDFLLELNVENIVLHVGSGLRPPRAGLSKQEILDRRVKGVTTLLEAFDGTHNYLCLENLVANMKTSAEIKELVDILNNPHIGVCYDTGHLNENHTLETQRDFVYNLSPLIRCTHINDNDGINEMHVIPYSQALDLPRRGINRVDFEEVCHALKVINYDGNINFELPGEIKAPLPVLTAKLKYIAELGRYFINLIKGE